jgi:long-chain fatty acid transport protein
MRFRGTFTLNMDDDFFTQDLASQGLQYPKQVEGNAEISFPLPGSVRLGAAWDVTPRLGVGANVAYTFWSEVQTFAVAVQSADLAQPKIGLPDRTHMDLPRRWMNTIAADVVVRFAATDRIRLWAPLGYRSPATPDATMDVASLDGDRFVAGLGGEVRLGETYALVGDAAVQTIAPRHVVGSENDVGNGDYRFTLWVFGIAVRISL